MVVKYDNVGRVTIVSLKVIAVSVSRLKSD